MPHQQVRRELTSAPGYRLRRPDVFAHSGAGSWVRRFAILGVKGAYFASAKDVDWAEAYGNYVRLDTGREMHLLREKMSTFTEKVDPRRFLRIHRSYVINVDRVARLSPHEHEGGYLIVLQDGTRLRSSRSYAAAIRQLMVREIADSQFSASPARHLYSRVRQRSAISHGPDGSSSRVGLSAYRCQCR
jgi:DNA-binding LytR/AlgR family response regulator